MLQSVIARLGVRDVHFLGQVSNEELTAVYDIADLFLCASEHEGFCVPLIESFYKRVPVVAFAATAVPATMDGAGVLYSTKDPFEIARLMAAVLDDPDVEAAILQSQDEALDRLRRRDFRGTLLTAVDRLRALGPRQPPEVPWDFWSQFSEADRLEELRQFRPSLFRALPERPPSDGGPRMTDGTRLISPTDRESGTPSPPSSGRPRSATGQPSPSRR